MAIGRIFGVFGISGSGLSAQRKNLEVRAENIANAESFDRKTGEPYKPKEIEFYAVDDKSLQNSDSNTRTSLLRNFSQHMKGIAGHFNDNSRQAGVSADEQVLKNSDTKLIYAPDHPHANAEGYVEVADVNMIDEMVKLMTAARAYEANATVLNSAKDMFKKALEI
ncbi:MAG TPA: flagellar basal body rod protein FlgC [bacterium]|nr:flagellar basal body rod protein FlgC [bacterium]HPN43164.1 flagellar basal body rod protein FlgC [bacterium]